MNAIEEIEAARAKLLQLKADSTPGAWVWDEPNQVLSDPTDQGLRNTAGEWVLYPVARDYAGIDATAVDRELIVVLHRTIDAQLAILEWAAANTRYAPSERTHALARAINGSA